MRRCSAFESAAAPPSNSSEDEDDGIDRIFNITSAEEPATAILEAAPLKERVSNFERQLIQKALEDSRSNISEAARLLGVKRTTLIEKMGRLDIRKGN